MLAGVLEHKARSGHEILTVDETNTSDAPAFADTREPMLTAIPPTLPSIADTL